MCVGLNIYIDDNLMFTELSSRERVSVCENMHLSDNLHFTDSRRRTSMYLLGVNHLFFLHSVISLTECIGIVRVGKYRVVCLSVRLSVRVSVCPRWYGKTYGSISMKLTTNSPLYV